MNLHLHDKIILVSGGAKGIGETPMDGPAAAVAAAIENATGANLNALPMTPERVLAGVQAWNKKLANRRSRRGGSTP